MKAITLQKRWASDARRDEIYLRNRAAHTHGHLKAVYSHEANIAHYWWKRRLASLKKGGMV